MTFLSDLQATTPPPPAPSGAPYNVKPEFHAQVEAWAAGQGFSTQEGYVKMLEMRGGTLPTSALVDPNGPADCKTPAPAMTPPAQPVMPGMPVGFPAPQAAPAVVHSTVPVLEAPAQATLPGFEGVNPPESPVDVAAAAQPDTGATVDVQPKPLEEPQATKAASAAKPAKLSKAQLACRDAVYSALICADPSRNLVEALELANKAAALI